ncbi:MAG: HD-GYP domain-containing protein [Bacillota bacterium]
MVQLRRSGTPIESVRADGLDIELLSTGDGTEVIRHVLRPGARWALRPAEGWDALEWFMVLSGTLRWLRPDGDILLHAGDHVAARPVTEDCLFQAEGEVVLLYVTSQPVFHRYSRETREMMELAVAVEEKDGYTADHCRRIMTRSMQVGRSLGLSAQRLFALHFAAFHHDLGKVAIPDSILGKPGPLTEDEWVVIRRHPIVGREMIERTHMQEAGPIIEQHHERLDGSGYPYGLKGDAILVEAQIVAVADSYDAMTSDRVYRRAKTAEEAAGELKEKAGVLYRDDVVQAFLQCLADERSVHEDSTARGA